MAIETVSQYTYWQWDVNCAIAVDPSYKDYAFLFENEGNSVAYVSYAKEEDEQYKVVIPNIVLTRAGKVWVYYCEASLVKIGEAETVKLNSLKTRAKLQLIVEARAKPDDYAYPEVDLPIYETLEIAIDHTNDRIDETIDYIDRRTNKLNKRITNLEKQLVQGSFLKTNDTTYVSVVPARACPYAALESLQGNSEVINYAAINLLDTAEIQPDTVFDPYGDTTMWGQPGSNCYRVETKPNRHYVFSKRDGTPISVYIWEYGVNGGRINEYYGVSQFVSLAESGWVWIEDNSGLDLSEIRFIEAEVDIKNAAIEQIRLRENLIPTPYVNGPQEIGGVTIIPNEDGSIFLKGRNTSGSSVQYVLSGGTIEQPAPIPEWFVPGNTYRLSGVGSNVYLYIKYYNIEDGQEVGIIHVTSRAGIGSTAVPEGYTYYRIYLSMNTIFSSYLGRTIRPMISTSSEASFEDTVIYRIPEEVRDIDGYGFGWRQDTAIGWMCNKLDIINKKHYTNYKMVDELFGEDESRLSFYEPNDTSEDLQYANCAIYNLRDQLEARESIYFVTGEKWLSDMEWYDHENGFYDDWGRLVIRNPAFTSLEAVKQWLKEHPVRLVYCAKVQEEIDVSEFLPDEMIEVKPGALLIFDSKEKVPVTSKIVYLLKEENV